MASRLSRILQTASICALACASASADPVYIRDGMTVDRAGNTFADLSSGFSRFSVVVLDAAGQISHCGPISSRIVEARPRRDGAGFLVMNRESGQLPLTLERWDARGQVEWRFETRGSDFAATADGGAVIWEEAYGQPDGRVQAQIVRVDATGALRWRTPLYADEVPALAVDMHEDDLGRIHFAAEPQGSFIIHGPNGMARLGMVNADGRMGWLVEDPRSSTTPVSLLDDGKGDLWWYIGAGSFTAQGVPYRASQLQRWTPWGLPLASYDGPATVAGTEIVMPALDDRDAVWYLAWRDVDPKELVRLGAAGREARHALEFDIDYGDQRERLVRLAAGRGAAWIAGWSADAADHLKVQRYTNAGLSWTRYLPGGDEVRGLVVDEAGDVRVAAVNAAGSGWIASIAARRGEENWRVAADSLHQACEER